MKLSPTSSFSSFVKCLRGSKSFVLVCVISRHVIFLNSLTGVIDSNVFHPKFRVSNCLRFLKKLEKMDYNVANKGTVKVITTLLDAKLEENINKFLKDYNELSVSYVFRSVGIYLKFDEILCDTTRIIGGDYEKVCSMRGEGNLPSGFCRWNASKRSYEICTSNGCTFKCDKTRFSWS